LFAYDAAGRVVKTVPPLGAPTLTRFGPDGEVAETVLDNDNSGALSAPDRVRRTTSAVVQNATLGGQTLGAGTLRTESALNDEGSEVVLARSWTSLDGLATAQRTGSGEPGQGAKIKS
jgi:hypothetical protein